MGRKKHLNTGDNGDSALLRVSTKAANISKALSGLRLTSVGEAADYLIVKYGEAEVEKLMKAKLKQMDKKS